MGELYKPTQGMLYPQGGPTGALYSNPLMAQKFANQREANARPDVTDIFGYGDDWLGWRVRTLMQQMPHEAMLRGEMPMMGMGAMTKAFHGSPIKGLKELSLTAPKTTGGGFNRYGVSISPDEKVAARYASDFGKGQVYKVDADIKKTLALQASEFEKLQSLVSKIDNGSSLTELEQIGLEMLLKKAGADVTGHPIEAIRRAGYDSIAKDAGRYGIAEREILVFDPKAVKILQE